MRAERNLPGSGSSAPGPFAGLLTVAQVNSLLLLRLDHREDEELARLSEKTPSLRSLAGAGLQFPSVLSSSVGVWREHTDGSG